MTEKGLSPVEADRILDEPELDKALEGLPVNPGETVLPDDNKESNNGEEKVD